MVFGLRCKRDAFDLMLSWKEHSPSVKHQAKLANFMALEPARAALAAAGESPAAPPRLRDPVGGPVRC
ncbi:hypothetical protein DIPPA_11028 [Diplonema papillatum]|nr:hypothetical protein DIPPA_11028 [Diplonema papillatum]